jgi:ferric-dicitrate binding protein FerR (iron transport regulator)
MNKRFEDLLDAHLDGRLSAADKAELEALLLASPEARKAFWEHAALHGLTHEALQLKGTAAKAAPEPIPLFTWRVITGLAAAAVIAVFVGYPLLRSPNRVPTPPGVTFTGPQLANTRGAVVLVRDGVSQEASTGFALRERDALRVAAGGTATVVLADGTRFEIEGGSELSLLGPELKQVDLRAGRLVADVAKQPAGQHVELATALARLTVHGTRFVLGAGPLATRLDVSEGLVRMVHAQRDSDMDIGAGQFAVALADQPLLGGLTPVASSSSTAAAPAGRDFARHPFSDESPWNKPLGDAKRIAVDSPALDLTGHGMVVQPLANDRPIVVATAADPVVSVENRYDGQDLVKLRLPAGAIGQAGGRLRNYTVIDAESGTAHELIQADRDGDTVRAMLVYSNDLRSAGVPPQQAGHTFSGNPLVAGAIRSGELQSGIRHAVAASALHTALSRQLAHGQPMERKMIERMAASGNVGLGTRLALPRDFDPASVGIAADSPAGRVAQALRDYGAIVTHSYGPAPANPGGWKQPHLVLFADAPESELRALSQDLMKLAAHLTVVANE